MSLLPHNFLALSMVVLLLGIKHGFDADHLAIIDSLTRFNSKTNPKVARFCGVYFSLGHGVIVIATALAVTLFAQHWQTQPWLETFGAWVSILFLALLGFLNLRTVFVSDPSQIVRLVGLKGRFLGQLTQTGKPVLVALIGALFALSFDTISQTALFALTANHFGGWEHALLLGLLFMFGMLATDGINGYWVARLIYRTDQIALVASRVMGLVVAGISLLVAFLGVAKLTIPIISVWIEGREHFISLAIILIITASFLFAVWLTRTHALLKTGINQQAN